jgi:hypothetical protein
MTDTRERAEQIAESFVNGNKTWVKQQLEDKTTLSFMVLDAMIELYPDYVESFGKLMRS